jgi:hypothetical protein
MAITKIDPVNGTITTDDGKSWAIDAVLNERGDNPAAMDVKREYDAIVPPEGANLVTPGGGVTLPGGRPAMGIGSAISAGYDSAKSGTYPDVFTSEPGSAAQQLKQDIFGLTGYLRSGRGQGGLVPMDYAGASATLPAARPTPPAGALPTGQEAPIAQEQPPAQTSEQRPAISRPSQGGGAPRPTTWDKLESERARAVSDMSEAQQNALSGAAVTDAQIAETMGEKTAIYEQQQQAAMARENERRKAIAVDNARLNELEKDYLNTKIENPWQSQGTGKTILQGIAIALGQFSASRGGGQNAALQIINGAINDDLKIQQMNLDRKGAVLANARGALARTRQEYQDQNVAMAAANYLALKKVESTMDSIQQSGISAQKQPLMDELRAKIQIQETERKEQFYLAQQAARQQAAATATRRAAAINQFESNETSGMKTMSQVAMEKDGQERLVNINGRLYQTRGNMRAKEAAEKVDAATSTADGLNSLQKYYENIGVLERGAGKILRPLNADERSYAKAKYDIIINKYARFLSPGIVTETDKRDARETIPDPTNLVNFGLRGAYAGIKSQMNAEINAMTKNMYRVIGPGDLRNPQNADGSPLQFGPPVK